MFSSNGSQVSGSPPDAQFNYVTMLLHGDGTNGAQNNTFLDGSTNNFTITRNGNTTQGSFSPYGSNWGNYFDGTSDYFTLGAQAAFSFGTGDFTIEGWFFINVNGTHAIIDFRPTSTNGAYILLAVNTSNQPYLYANSSQVITGSALTLNAWHHFALTRSGTSTKLFIDGTQSGSTYTDSTNYTVGASRPMIGSLGFNPGAGADLNGYLSNLRILKGTALYTANFTPPTSPLTAITNTSLLTCQSNRFIDNSANNFTLTVNGTPSVQRFNPFGTSTAYSTSVIGGSGYFDGTGDSLNCVANSTNNPQSGDDYTVEAYIYLTNQGGVTTIYSGDVAGYFAWRSATQRFEFVSSSLELRLSYTYPLNRWCHVAVSRQSGTVRMFVDGVLQSPTVASGSATGNTDTLVGASTAYYFGSYTNATSGPFYGYISGFRLVKGTAVYTASFTPPTTPPTAITNTAILLNMTNAGIYDNAMMNDLETVGNAQISTSVVKYGTGSLYFDGTGDALKAVYTPNFAFSTGDFTIELWLYINSTSGTPIVFDMRENGGSATPVIYLNGSALVYYTNAGVRITGGTLSTGTWYHVAVCRSGTSTKMFLDGTQIGSTYTDSTNYAGGNLWLGSYYSGGYDLNGYIDDLRITKGYARYTANFTPPTAAFPNTGPI